VPLRGRGMFRKSLCGICAISEISVGFWTARRCQTTPGRSYFIIGPLRDGIARVSKKQTQIAQARCARSQISQIDSVCRHWNRTGRARNVTGLGSVRVRARERAVRAIAR